MSNILFWSQRVNPSQARFDDKTIAEADLSLFGDHNGRGWMPGDAKTRGASDGPHFVWLPIVVLSRLQSEIAPRSLKDELIESAWTEGRRSEAACQCSSDRRVSHLVTVTNWIRCRFSICRNSRHAPNKCQNARQCTSSAQTETTTGPGRPHSRGRRSIARCSNLRREMRPNTWRPLSDFKASACSQFGAARCLDQLGQISG